MARRRYSDDDKARVLAALDANGGNVKGTARQLGVPERTLAGWARGRGDAGGGADLRAQKRGDLLAAFDDLAWMLLGKVSDPALAARATYIQAATALGIVMDKRNNLLLQSAAEDLAKIKRSLDERGGVFVGGAGEGGGGPPHAAGPAGPRPL